MIAFHVGGVIPVSVHRLKLKPTPLALLSYMRAQVPKGKTRKPKCIAYWPRPRTPGHPIASHMCTLCGMMAASRQGVPALPSASPSHAPTPAQGSCHQSHA